MSNGDSTVPDHSLSCLSCRCSSNPNCPPELISSCVKCLTTVTSQEPLQVRFYHLIMDLNQARMTRAGNKQLNFSVKKKPQTADYVLNIRSIFCD